MKNFKDDKKRVKREKLSLVNWVGGKSQLRKTIATYIPEDITAYIEPFGGAGWVLFYKSKWASCEVYNDINQDLFNLFNIVKFHPEALEKELEFILPIRSQFCHFKKNFTALTDIQKAAKFLFLLSFSYAGKMDAFGYGKTRGSKSLENLKHRIYEISYRLERVYLENLDYLDILKRYDAVNSFFYLDPPYYIDSVKVYETINHFNLAESLKKLQGRFLLSYDNRPEIKELYKDFNVIEVSRPMTFGITKFGKRKEYKELLIKNY